MARKMFSPVLSKAVDLRMFSIAGGAPASTKRPRKPPDNTTNYVLSGSTKILRKQAKIEKMLECNDSEPRQRGRLV